MALPENEKDSFDNFVKTSPLSPLRREAGGVLNCRGIMDD